MIDDITTTIKAQLYDRVTSPLSGAFLLSWVVWNWKFITIVLSDLKAPVKLTYIDLYIFPNTTTILSHGVLLPLVSAILLLTVYPIPAKWFYKISHRHKKTLKGVQQSIEDETPMTLEEAADLRKSYRAVQSQHEKDIATKTTELASTKNLQNQLEISINQLSEQLKSSSMQVAQLEERVSSLEIKNESLSSTVGRLSLFLRSILPTIHFNQEEKKLNRHNPISLADSKYEKIIPPATLAEDTIEQALQIHISRTGIFQQHSPKIFAAGGVIYLQTSKISRDSFIIGKFDASNPTLSLDPAYTLLSHLHKDGPPAQRS